MRLYEMAFACRLYKTFSGFDSALRRLRSETGPALDLTKASHRKALVTWLNKWGCRQFAKAYHQMATNELSNWAERFADLLPSEDTEITELSDAALGCAVDAYCSLKVRPASLRRGKVVTFGPSGAAKVLYAIQPNALPPWDDKIRKVLRHGGFPNSYRQFITRVKREVQTLKDEAAQLGIEPHDIPGVVSRPESTLVKLVDEYYWVTITRGCKPPSMEDLKSWLNWVREPGQK